MIDDYIVVQFHLYYSNFFGVYMTLYFLNM